MPAKAGNNWDDFKGFQGEFAEPEPSQNGHKAQEEESTKEKVAEEPKVIDTKRSEAVEIDTERPKPPFWGTKLLQPEDIPIEEVFWYLDLQALIAGQWQFRIPKGQT